MAIDPEKIDRTASAFLDVAFAENGWTRALDALVSALDASVVFLLPVSRRVCGPFPHSTYAAESLDCYVRGKWFERDIRRRAVPKVRFKCIFDDHDSMPFDELVKTDYYNDLLRPFDFGPYIAVTLPFADELMVLSIQRPLGAAALSPRDVQLLASVRDRLAFGAELASRVDQVRLAGHQDAIAALTQPCALLDRTGKVIMLNDAAVALQARGLVLRDGHIVSPDPENNRQFGDFLRAAISPLVKPDGLVRQPAFFLNRVDRLPLVVRVSALRGRAWHYFSRAWAIVLFSDPEERLELTSAALSGIFGLTPAEIRVIDLVVKHGKGAAGIAERLGLSRNTVKYHLSNIFSKTGAGSVADLIAIVAGTRE